MKKILIPLLAFLSAATAFADTSFPIYQATPTNHVCTSGRNCAPLVDGNGRFVIAPQSSGSGSLSETIVNPVATVLPTALPTAFSTPQFAPVTGGLTSAYITNTTNQDVWCADTVGTPSAQIIVPAGSTWYDNFGAKGQKLSTGIGCIHPSSTPVSGAVFIGGDS